MIFPFDIEFLPFDGEPFDERGFNVEFSDANQSLTESFNSVTLNNTQCYSNFRLKRYYLEDSRVLINNYDMHLTNYGLILVTLLSKIPGIINIKCIYKHVTIRKDNMFQWDEIIPFIQYVLNNNFTALSEFRSSHRNLLNHVHILDQENDDSYTFNARFELNRKYQRCIIHHINPEKIDTKYLSRKGKLFASLLLEKLNSYRALEYAIPNIENFNLLSYISIIKFERYHLTCIIEKDNNFTRYMQVGNIIKNIIHDIITDFSMNFPQFM